MIVKSWKPNSISSKSPLTFVEEAPPLVDAQESQEEEYRSASGWTQFHFPSVSAAVDHSPTERSGYVQEVQENLSCWKPSEIEDAFVVNRNRGFHLDKIKENESEGQYFNLMSQKSDSILAQTNAQAAEIIARAEAKANEIIQQAENQAAQLTHQAYQDGLNAANAEISDLLKTARAIVEEVEAWRDSTLSKGEMMMLRLVIEIAQSLFGEGLPLDPDTLGNAFSRALAQAKTLGDLRIYVHPEDAAALTPHWANQQATFSGQKIELIPSEIIKRGGCFIEGQYGSVDARIETQLQMAKDTLMDTLSLPVGNAP